MVCGTGERTTKELIAWAPSTPKIKAFRRGLERDPRRVEVRSRAAVKDVLASHDEYTILVKGGKFKE